MSGWMMRQQIQTLGLCVAALLCLALAVLKLTIAVHWSWWRVLLPLLVVLGHNALYVTVGFVWFFFTEYGAPGEEATIRPDHNSDAYQVAALLCFLIFLDNLQKRIGGPGDNVWFWLRAGRGELIVVFGVLSVVCQLLFWSGAVRRGHRGTRGE